MVTYPCTTPSWAPLELNKDDNGMLEDSMVEVSPEMEATLLRLDDAGEDWPTGQVAASEEHPTTEG